MNKTKIAIAKQKKLLARLKRQNESLKARNKRLRTTNKSLEKKNIILRKQIRKSQRLRREQEQEQEQEKIYRYSIAYAYYGNDYQRTFRAEVYTNTKQNESNIRRQLERFLRDKISQQNNGIKAMFNRANYEGIEAEEIGSNDLGRSEINRMRFSID